MGIRPLFPIRDPAQSELHTRRNAVLKHWLRVSRPHWSQVLVSLLVVVLGWMSAQAMNQVDRDLRILYADYTLAVTDLAHIMADMMRYRNTIIRALESQSRQDFERIISSLQDQRARIYQAVDRYAEASVNTASDGQEERQRLQAVKDSLDGYFAAARRTVNLLTQVWTAGSPQEAADFRHQAELQAAENAGPKLVQVSVALEELLVVVAEVAKSMRDEGTRKVRGISVLLVGGSALLVMLNLLALWPPGSPRKELSPPGLRTEPTQSSALIKPTEED
ncbi:MAG: hypothetical protein FJ246_03240 [Nitrospira sp.]|nr:hypothetical protein [Nitrospira sp.]